VTTTAPDVDDHSPVHPGEHHDHGPSDSQYLTIFWVLVGITVLETSTYWWEEWFNTPTAHKVAVPVILILMVVKFFLVASYFMHLRFDSALLKRTFYFGLAVAIIVYLVALTSMNIWTDSGNPWFNDPAPAVSPPEPVSGAPLAGETGGE
jgi:cytochrome c oxidase subunit 4